MNYLTISKCNMVNGSGLRVVLWVSGCSHCCPNCQNAFSQDPKQGVLFDQSAKEEVFHELEQDWCAGLTFSGGDPLYIENRSQVIALAREIKEKFPTKSIWLYTGYTWHQIVNDQTMSGIIKYVDTIVDGQYIEALRDVTLEWRGSSNQEVIDVKQRLRKIQSLANQS